MSHFPEMLVSPDSGFKTFVLHIAPHGACAIFEMGAGGKAVSMVAGRASDVMLGSLMAVDPRFRLLRLGPSPGEIAQPGHYGLAPEDVANRWRNLVELINGRRAVGLKLRAIAFFVSNYYKIPEINFDPDAWRWEVTDAGREADAGLDARAETA